MDGDFYLIKLVKKRPILWHKSYHVNRDAVGRNTAWKEIARLIGVEVNWIRSRWYTLRERFVKELKLAYNNKEESKYKYFKDMLFLLKHVEFRKKPDAEFDSFVEQLTSRAKSPDNRERANEFIITRKEIDEDDELDTECIFVEITDYREEDTNEDKSDDSRNSDNKNNYVEVCDSTAENIIQCEDSEDEENSQESPEPPSKRLNLTLKSTKESVDLHPIVKRKSEQPIQKTLANERTVSVANERTVSANRCEDAIFGELVTAMLNKMDEAKKKTAKKEIMNILLS